VTSRAHKRPRFAGLFAGRHVAAALAITALASLGCGSLGSYTTSPADYAAYRSTRVSPTLEGRLAAAARYLELFPKGEFEPEVRTYFHRAEPVFFAAKDGSVAGLEAYLRVLPKGPHSEQALTELSRLRRARTELEELRAVTQLGDRLSRLTAERARARAEIDAWLRRFLDPAAWDRPLVEAPDELLVAFRLALPEPVCGSPEQGEPESYARKCSKILELPYTVTSDSGPEELQATIEIALAQDASGRVIDVTIGGPDLFLRLEETFTARALPPADKPGRMSGASRAVEIARRQFQERVSTDPACKKQPAAPAVLHLACKGFRVIVRPGLEGEDDTIRVTREAPSLVTGPGAPGSPG
jgi:hypothetical protein